MKRLYRAVLLAVICLLFSTAPLCAAPNVDGFIEVPWGASIDDVKTAMAKRGFTLQKQDAEYVEYIGTFANEPALLTFTFKNNLFYHGKAELLNAKGKDLNVTLNYYREFAEILAAKYGKTESRSAYQRPTFFSRWDNLPTAATPPGRVNIEIIGGLTVFGKAENTVWIVYSIGSDWVRAKTVPKDI